MSRRTRRMSFTPYKRVPGTLADFVQNCPGCKKSVVWPFTQDIVGCGRAASKIEEKIMLKLFPLMPEGFYLMEVGTRIPTTRVKDQLWHFPCYAFEQVRLFQVEMQKLVT